MNFENPKFENPQDEGPEALETYLQGKSDEDLATMAEDPMGALTTISEGADAHPASGFSEEELKGKASDELESRKGSGE